MKILIIDRDRLTAQLLVPRLEADGHEVVIQPVRNEAVELLKTDRFDMIMMDTSPLPSPRPVIIAVKKAIFPYFSYLMLMSHGSSIDEVVHMGLNDYITKPLDLEDFYLKVENASNLVRFDRMLRDETMDIRTDGIVFGKKPFLHLFHSALDRAARYGEQAFLLFFRITSYDNLVKEKGEEAANEQAGRVVQYIARLRRQSDFLARINVNEMVLIMQRPSTGSEPMDAAERFSYALKEHLLECEENEKASFSLELHLIELPMGNTLLKKHLA